MTTNLEAMLGELRNHGRLFGQFLLLYDKEKFIGKLELGILHDKLAINYIEVEKRQKGVGTRIMKMLCELSDKHQLPLILEIKEMDNPKKRTPKKVLRSWYKSFGFKQRPSYGVDSLVRLPERKAA